MKHLCLLISAFLIFQSCDIFPPNQSPNSQNPNTQNNDDKGVIVFEIPANLSTETTDWIFSPNKSIKIPDLPIDSIIFQAPLRSVNEHPGAEAILFNASENNFINSSLLSSNAYYTIVNYRSRNLKGYFSSKEYLLKVGLRSTDDNNAVSIPYECKLIIYHQL